MSRSQTPPADGPRRGARRLIPLGLLLTLIASLALAGLAQAADPLVPQQTWLPRVVPAGELTPAADRIPPIAIIETGFDATHPDFQGGWVSQRRRGPVPTPGNAAEEKYFRDGVAHGTAVASVIAAPRDGVGIEGFLPGARVRVYNSAPVCPAVAAAIRQAVDDGARVINASYGFVAGGACAAHQDATSYAFGNGALIVAAAGNFRPTQPWVQPGNDLHVLTVSALNALDQPTGFSHQNVYADLSAPGEDIFLAVPAFADTDDGVVDGYASWDGTSFAAPIVTAAAAWLMAERPTLSADQVAEVLRRSARDLQSPGWDISTGWGAVDLAAALATTAPRHDPYEPNDDIRWVAGRAGFRADTPFLRKASRDVVRARLDVLKDPFDVYPVWVPAGEAIAIRLTPSAVRADLYAWRPEARTAYGRTGVLAKSRRPGLQVERLTITNSGTKGRRIWVEVRRVRSNFLAGSYVLDLRRLG